MATISFESSDGSFEVVLGKDEPFPAQWNRLGVAVFRENEDGSYRVIKDYQETLVGV